MKYIPMHMHLHASHEPIASISSHMERCRGLGIRHMWMTEHDSRIGRKKKPLDSFLLKENSLKYKDERGVTAGFAVDTETTGTITVAPDGDIYLMSLHARAGEYARVEFSSSGKNHSEPLFSGVKLAICADACVKPSASVAIEVILSERPPEAEHARMIYYFGKKPEIRGNHVQYIELPNAPSGEIVLDLTKDASDIVGGLDNALCYVGLIASADGGEAEFTFRKMCFIREMNANEAREAQKKLVSELSEKYGVEAFVGFEITEAGKAGVHKNCFSTAVPVIEYEDYGYAVSELMVVEHVKKHGGIFSYNHPLCEIPAKDLSDTDKCEKVSEFACYLAENHLFGASVIEVAFPEGRGGFESEYYTMLWDKLSLAGVFVTGDGDNDAHSSKDPGWTYGNNFATYIGLYECETPCEENIRKALIRGSVFAADPTKGVEIDISSDGHPAGCIKVGEKCNVLFTAKAPASTRVITVVNGNAVRDEAIAGGKAEFSLELIANRKYNFVRFEIRDVDNRLIGLSNPIYLVRDEEDVPPSANVRKAFR